MRSTLCPLTTTTGTQFEHTTRTRHTQHTTQTHSLTNTEISEIPEFSHPETSHPDKTGPSSRSLKHLPHKYKNGPNHLGFRSPKTSPPT